MVQDWVEWFGDYSMNVAVTVNAAGGGGASNIRWLVSDQLGTPRMVVDETGSLAGVKRRDYLPFGEEIGAGVGGRTPDRGYGIDNVRQQFTGKERDGETELDFFAARYYSSPQGRFTSVDPSNISMKLSDPQTWNRYTYTLNNPLRFIDKNGKWPTETHHQFIADAFDGLSDSEIEAIQYGSNLVDTYFGTGGHLDLPITLLMEEAPKHAMTPDGMTVEDAYQASMGFAADMANEARFNQMFSLGGKDGPVSEHALTSFGKGAHMYMDSTSPSHTGWQRYSTPTTNIYIGGVDILTYDKVKWVREGLDHKEQEKRQPTEDERKLTLMLLRAYYLTTFGDRAFQRAVPQTENRQAAYNYLKQNGIKYKE